MQLKCDMVLTDLVAGTSKSGKEYYMFEGVIVRCDDFPVLSGVAVKKFVTQEVYQEFGELTADRFDCSVGISRTSADPRECDIAFKLFINGIWKDAPEQVANVSQPDSSKDKNK